jgi:DnaK suppressor protein
LGGGGGARPVVTEKEKRHVRVTAPQQYGGIVEAVDLEQSRAVRQRPGMLEWWSHAKMQSAPKEKRKRGAVRHRVVRMSGVTLGWSATEQEVDLMDRATLLYFRGLLEHQLAQLSSRLESGLLGSEAHNDDRDPKDEADLATSRSAREWAYRMQGRNHRLQRELSAALQRIRDGEFGICEQCADEIDIQRLHANPWTSVCIACKRTQESFARRKVA